MTKRTEVMSLSVPPATHQKAKAIALSKYGENKLSHLATMLFDDFAGLEIETHEKLRATAKKKEMPVSELVEFMTDRFPLDDETVKPVVLKMPLDIINDKQRLAAWLNAKVNAIVTHLHPE